MADREPHPAPSRPPTNAFLDQIMRVAVTALLAGAVWTYSQITQIAADTRSLRESLAHTRDVFDRAIATERGRTDSAIAEIGRRIGQMEAQTNILSAQQAAANRTLTRIEVILEGRYRPTPDQRD